MARYAFAPSSRYTCGFPLRAAAMVDVFGSGFLSFLELQRSVLIVCVSFRLCPCGNCSLHGVFSSCTLISLISLLSPQLFLAFHVIFLQCLSIFCSLSVCSCVVLFSLFSGFSLSPHGTSLSLLFLALRLNALVCPWLVPFFSLFSLYFVLGLSSCRFPSNEICPVFFSLTISVRPIVLPLG